MPSLQLGVLSSWVRTHVPEMRVDEVHHYLDIAGELGAERYDEICNLLSEGGTSLALPEALYAALLFPGERERITSLAERVFSPPGGLARLLLRLEAATKASVAQVAARGYALAGFSVSFFQTFSSVYYAQQLRAASPETLLLFGGPELPGKVGQSFLSAFEWMDFIATAEGELPLQRICEILTRQPRSTWREAIARVPTILSRQGAQPEMPQSGKPQQAELKGLDQLPLPSFSAYFQQRPAGLGGRSPMLPIETSRGCWWDRSNIHPKKSCSFCNLNATWSGYREKSPLRAVEEIRELSQRYGCSRIMIVDNVLRQGAGLRVLLPALVRDGEGRSMILEAKASLQPHELCQLRLAGVEEMQLGIEALSNGILQRLINKGTSVMANIRALRWLEDLGIKHVGNLILEYPGATVEDLQETLRNIDFVSAYQPLIGGQFWLGYYSPMYRLAEEFGLSRIRNMQGFDACLPVELRGTLYSLWKDYDSPASPEVADLWLQVSLKLSMWRLSYQALCARHGIRSLLLFRDDGQRLEITDYRDEPPRVMLLEGARRRIYLAATAGSSVEKLRGLGSSDEELAAFIQEMVGLRWMYAESNRAVSLAVRETPVVPPPYLSFPGQEAAPGGLAAE
jgi:ribosomal peptide maturation radical SAM protein 1